MQKTRFCRTQLCDCCPTSALQPDCIYAICPPYQPSYALRFISNNARAPKANNSPVAGSGIGGGGGGGGM